jgi:hypothetical protein
MGTLLVCWRGMAMAGAVGGVMDGEAVGVDGRGPVGDPWGCGCLSCWSCFREWRWGVWRYIIFGLVFGVA